MKKKLNTILDCIVVGGGIGGLTAGLYLARFGCQIKIIDSDNSRAKIIPCSHNFPAFPEGISGKNILQRMRKQYLKYGPKIVEDSVQLITRHAKKTLFTVHTKNKNYFAKYIILATGVMDIEPVLPNLLNAVKCGLIRHCLVCDAYEARQKKIAVLGQGLKGLKTAILLSRYSSDITYFNLDNRSVFTPIKKRKYLRADIKIIKDPIESIKVIAAKKMQIDLNNKSLLFDVVYSALGAEVRSQLGICLGAKYTKANHLMTDKKQQTNIPGLYAIGDVSTGINQMSVAASHGVIASMDIFNKLCAL